MKPSLQLRLGQQLTMTPQLQQAIRLLQLPVLELSSQIQEALDSNVMLETAEPAADGPAEASLDSSPESPEVVARESGDMDWQDVRGPRSDPWRGPDDRQAEVADTGQQNLTDHLLWQLEMEQFTPRETVMGQAIIDAINEDGYLTEDLEEILQNLDAQAAFSAEEMEATLAKIQELDPVGIGARTLGECLAIQLLQLTEAEPGRDTALRIAEGHLEMMAEQDYAGLRRQLGVSETELDIALALVKACHPRPGSAVQTPDTQYVIPDVYVRRLDGRWIVEVNRSVAPRLQVNQTYARMLRGEGSHETLRSQLQEARWLVRSLEIRHDTLVKVAMCIVERQSEFLEHGEEAMKPMVLKDVAEATGMHESTISRVTANKFMHTPRGVFEFRYFFSSQVSSSDGSEQSSTAIRAKIRRLIGQEDPTRPLSDSKIATILAEEGVEVARRTVAKYREGMGIASSSRRKQRQGRR